MADHSITNVTNVEADGVSGKAVAWSVIGSLVIGFALGAWSISAFLRFEPSEEYVQTVAELQVFRNIAEDSLDALAREIEEADAEADEAAELAQDAATTARTVRREAEMHRARADSLQAIRADEEDVELLIEENVELREAVEGLSATNVFQRRALVEMERTITAQRLGIQQRDAAIDLMASEIEEQERALAVAMGEVARATGQLNGWKWKVGIGTVALGGLALMAF